MSDGGEAGHARYTYRLRLSTTACRTLIAEWDRCRWVWNQCVAESRRRTGGEKIGPAALDKKLTGWRGEHDWLRDGASVPQQQTIRDFGRSRAKAVKDIKDRVPQRRRAGMPGFKKKDVADPTLNYTLRGFRLVDGGLHLAGGLVVRPVWSRELPAAPSSVRVYRDSIGHWYASFVVPAQAQPLPAKGQAIGIDWGVKEIATTTSDSHDLPHPAFGKKAAVKLARYQRMMARRKPKRGQQGSRRYRKAKQLAAKLHKKVARQRQDTARKWAKAIVQDFDRVAVEDFKPKFLAKTTMARKAADAAIGATKTAMLEMGRKHCRDVRLVNPAHTTMDCRMCGARAKHRLLLSERTFWCEHCGYKSPRDKNSAGVMLNRAGFLPAGVDCARPGRSPNHRQHEPGIPRLQAGEDSNRSWQGPTNRRTAADAVACGMLGIGAGATSADGPQAPVPGQQCQPSWRPPGRPAARRSSARPAAAVPARSVIRCGPTHPDNMSAAVDSIVHRRTSSGHAARSLPHAETQQPHRDHRIRNGCEILRRGQSTRWRTPLRSKAFRITHIEV